MLSIIKQSEEMMKLFDLKTNHETELLGIDTRPYFSWKIDSEEDSTMQVSYHLILKDGGATVWDTGVRESSTEVLVDRQAA